MEYISKSEKETYEVAEKVAKSAKLGDIFALSGDLGSGKTTFAKGFARALGIKKEITSPTFVILKKYPLPKNKQKISFLIHIDCYRLNTVADAESIGLFEYLKADDNIILVEWPEKIADAFSEFEITKISFKFKDEKTRLINIK